MPPPLPAPRPAQVWLDTCYYFDRDTGECQPKYLLIVAVDRAGDLVTVVFTSKSHGMGEAPPCSAGPPRAGYFVGAPGGVLTKPTWADFSSLQDVDRLDFQRWNQSGRVRQIPRALPTPIFCGVLRCLLGFDDLTGRQAKVVGDVIQTLACP